MIQIKIVIRCLCLPRINCKMVANPNKNDDLL